MYPHRRVFNRTFANFAEIVQRLNETPFYSEIGADSKEHGNSSSVIAIFVQSGNTTGQIRVDPSHPEYARYRAFAQYALTSVKTSVAAARQQEVRSQRKPQDLRAVSVTHEHFGSCYFYVARFPHTGHTTIRFATVDASRHLVEHDIQSAVPFSIVRSIVERDKIASLYEDYPTMGHDWERVKVDLAYEQGAYTIDGPQIQFWPVELKQFVASIDRLVAYRVKICAPARIRQSVYPRPAVRTPSSPPS